MKRFVNLYDKQNDPGVNDRGKNAFEDFSLHPKSLTNVSAMIQCKNGYSCHRVHVHKLILQEEEGRHVRPVRYGLEDILILAHYKVRSREEFYGRVCTSQYHDKY
eukprot:12687702-Ditylum_brightwellii.AAC.1